MSYQSAMNACEENLALLKPLRDKKQLTLEQKIGYNLSVALLDISEALEEDVPKILAALENRSTR